MTDITPEEQKEANEALAGLRKLLNGPKKNLSTMPAKKVDYPLGLAPEIVEGAAGSKKRSGQSSGD